jgi:hypothetical protein
VIRSARANFFAVLIGAAGFLGLVMVGCSAPGKGPMPTGPLPTAAEVLENQHAAVDGLDKLWARAVVRVEGNDADGNWLAEQAEGVLQTIPPNKLALSLGKLNRTRLYLGSNDEWYWWFDMLTDGNRVAVVGRHEPATPEKTAELGLPVHPLDLIEALAITPLPDTIEVTGYDGQGNVVVEHPTRWGTRRVSYETIEWKPVRVQMLDDEGEALVEAELLGHARVSIVGDATRKPWVADRVEIRAAGFDGMVRLTLFDPQNKMIRDVAFDLETLAEKVYKIDRFHDLDQPAPMPAIETSPDDSGEGEQDGEP